MAFGDFTVVRSTVKRVLNSSGVLASVAVNTPAFEFNADGTYRGLLVEPAATNLLTYSQQFDDAGWDKDNVTVSANAITAPDGTMTADKVIPSTANSNKIISKQSITVASVVHTNSLYIKAGGYNFCKLSDATVGAAIVNLTTGSIVGTDAGFTATIADAGGGWWRVTLTYDATTSRGIGVDILLDASTPSFAGDGTSGIYIWGAQLETGSVATSYIPTVATTVTRTADDISLASASSLIGQTEGTFYCEFVLLNNNANSNLFNTEAVLTNSVTIHTDTNQFRGYVFADSVLKAVCAGGTPVFGTTYKMAYRYKSGDSALYVNGAQIAVSADAFTFTGTLAELNIGDVTALFATQQANGFRALATFPTGLSNAQLATLTTL